MSIDSHRLIEALHVVAGLVRSPEALANVLEAAGQVVLERAGGAPQRASPGVDAKLTTEEGKRERRHK